MITGAKPVEAAARIRKDVMTPASAQLSSGLYTAEVLDAIEKSSKAREDIFAEGWGVPETIEGQVVREEHRRHPAASQFTSNVELTQRGVAQPRDHRIPRRMRRRGLCRGTRRPRTSHRRRHPAHRRPALRAVAALAGNCGVATRAGGRARCRHCVGRDRETVGAAPGVRVQSPVQPRRVPRRAGHAGPPHRCRSEGYSAGTPAARAGGATAALRRPNARSPALNATGRPRKGAACHISSSSAGATGR